MVGCGGCPVCIVHDDMTLTRSKVKVTQQLKFLKLHCSRSISSAILMCSSKLMADYDNGTYSTACWSPISEFPSQYAMTRLQTSWNVSITVLSKGHILSGVLVAL